MRKGSITPFCAISVFLVSSVLLVLLESARVYGLNQVVRWRMNTGMDSVCAEFQPYLWSEYGLLFLDGAYGTEHFSLEYVAERLQECLQENANYENGYWETESMNLFRIKTKNVVVEEYSLATDKEGGVLLDYIAERMKEKLPLGVAENIYERFKNTAVPEESESGIKAAIEEAGMLIENALVERERTESGNNDTVYAENMVTAGNAARAENVANTENTGEQLRDNSISEEELQQAMEVKNALSNVSSLYNSLALDLILGAEQDISQRVCEIDNPMETREKKEGTLTLQGAELWYRKILVTSYLEEYFSHFLNEREHVLSYEIEYVLNGENSDAANLDATFKKILLMREAANVTCLLQDEERMQQVRALAGAVGVVAEGNPIVVQMLEIGIAGAWAYIESILDVRALVAGDKISLMKQPQEWTSSLADIASALDIERKANANENGNGYLDYLKMLLWATPDRTVAYRIMEIYELGLHENEEYKNCYMNQMIVALNCKATFEAEPVFYSLATLGDSFRGKFVFAKKEVRSYVP